MNEEFTKIKNWVTGGGGEEKGAISPHKLCCICGHHFYDLHKCPSSFLANDGIDY